MEKAAGRKAGRMSDLISRQAVLALAKEECDTAIIPYRKFVKDVNALSPVTPAQTWIPVSERMPKPRIDVWCNSDMGQMVGYYDEYAETWYGRDYLELIVTAWMPLPEPYEPQESEEEE